MKSTLLRFGSAALVCFGLAALAMPACSAKKNTQIMVSIDSDLSVPKDINAVRIVVTSGGTTLMEESYAIEHGQLRLPATLGISAANPENDLPTIDVKVYAYNVSYWNDVNGRSDVLAKEKEKLLRHSRLSFAKDRVVLLRMPLHFACFGFDTSHCNSSGGDEFACVAGECKNVAVADLAKLPDYSETQVFGGSQPASGVEYTSCFDPNKCLASTKPVTGDPSCVFDISSAGVDPAKTTVLIRHTRAEQAGYCFGGVCKVALDYDESQTEGWWFPNPADRTKIQLASGLCNLLQKGSAGGGFDGVGVTDACGTKTVNLPLCDVNLSAIPDAGAFDSSGPPLDAGADVGADGSPVDASGGDGGGTGTGTSDASMTDVGGGG